MSPSPIRYRVPWKVNKRSSEPDRWLDEMGFFRKHTARDSSCLFRAVSENVYNTQRYFYKVRIDCVRFMSSERHLFEGSLTCSFENYLKEMSNPSEWGGLIEISAMSHLYRRDFVIFEANKGPQTKICNGAKDLLDNGITPFPYKVAKALDPDIYRNIEFDVWSDLRRELRYGARYSDGTTLQVGVKCLCKLQSNQSVPYHCHIQEMRPDGGPCLVFIEELGEKRVVSYEQLEPLPVDEVRPWAPPYRFSRTGSQFMTLSQMLQQIGNITRKQGLKARIKKGDEIKCPEKDSQKQATDWKDDKSEPEAMQYDNQTINYSTYHHMDFFNFEPMPVEVETLPLMVDCRQSAGTPAHEMHTQHQHNGAQHENHHAQAAGSGAGDMAAQGVASPASVRASTPATTNALAPYSGGGNQAAGAGAGAGAMGGAGAGAVAVAGAYACSPYACKPVVWCTPQAHVPPPPPPPPGVNPHAVRSVHANGSDLPLNDIPTLRFYYNVGLECIWATYGPPPVVPPRPYMARDLAQDMQQISLHERPVMNHGSGEQNHKHKPPQNDKPPLNNQGKGNGQRPLLGPRFKRGGNQDGNQNSNHNQNKGHNSNMANKGPNNRRNSYSDNRNPPHMGYNADGECMMEQPVMTIPYIPYPPPIYPIPYYPVESDPAMMGMMGGMSFVGYEDGVEYGAPVQHYYPAPHYPPPPHVQHVPQHVAQPPHAALAPHAPHAPHAPLQAHPPQHHADHK
ncbi:unnamed protein product, partial [Iphiclides podalirius]